MSIHIFFKNIHKKIVSLKQKKETSRQLKNLQSLDKKLIFNLSKKQKFALPVPNIRQLKHLKKFLSIQEKRVMKISAVLIFISFIIIAIGLYQKYVVIIPNQGGEYEEATVGTPKFINPIIAQSDVDLDLTKLTFCSLLKYDKDLNLIPDIVSSYEISPDQKIYTLHLKNNVYWHDGTLLTANDVLFTFNIIKDSAFSSPLLVNFDGVQIEKIDDLTMKFALNEPYAPFLHNLTSGILPEHIWNNVSSDNFLLAEYNIKPIGCGPFVFDSLVKDKGGNIKSLTLKTFSKYYGLAPYLDSLTFKYYPDYDSASEALMNKTVLGLNKLSRQNNKPLSQNINVYQLPLPQYTALFFNLNKPTPWQKKELRQAVAYALNKEALINTVFDNFAKIADGPILEGFLGYNYNLKKYVYNPEKAHQLLKEDGWTVQDDVYKKQNTELILNITTLDKYENAQLAQEMQNTLKNLNIKVNIELLSLNDIKLKIKKRDYEALLYGEVLGTDPDPYPFWHSTQRLDPGLNLSLYANKQVDELIETARQVSLPQTRQEKYQQFQDLLIEDLPAIFLYAPYYIYLQNNKVKGFAITRISYPADRFNNIEQWYLKTKWVWK